jgi:hypothetical protein
MKIFSMVIRGGEDFLLKKKKEWQNFFYVHTERRVPF